VQLEPGNEAFLNNLAYAYIDIAAPESALPYLEQALARSPDYERARANLAQVQAALQARSADAATPATAPPAAPADMPPVTAEAVTDVRLDGLSIEVGNGNGVEGAARRMGDWLRRHGARVTRLYNVPRYGAGPAQVVFEAGRDAAAMAVTRALPGRVERVAGTLLHADLRVVVGGDLAAASGCGGRWPCAGAGVADAASAPLVVADAR